MTVADGALIVLGVLTVGLLVAIAWQVRRYHRENQSALGKLNHSVASVNAAVHLLRGDREKR